MSAQDQTLVVCGGGLAGLMVASSLAGNLGAAYNIVLLEEACELPVDFFYGSVTGPSGYEFFRSIGLNEPLLFQRSATSFSFGTQFVNWPSQSPAWMQCHHLPFPVIAGVPLHHHLTRHGLPLEPLLISARAASEGKFAHPPQDPASALSRAEYGYQFSVREWAALLQSKLHASKVRRIGGKVAEVKAERGLVQSICLETGEQVEADLFLDCTGPARMLMSAVGGVFEPEREIEASSKIQPVDRLGPPHRMLEAHADSWTSKTHLQNAELTLHVGQGESASSREGAHAISLGKLDQAWCGNCVAIGHAGAVLEPLTPAPMMLLQRDIERLMDLVPTGPDQSMERREFNRRYKDDVIHAHIFQSALFRFERDLDASYWRAASKCSMSQGLDRKIIQFENRGVLAKYDLEPFNDEDWIILHLGMGRRPKYYDRQLDGLPASEALRRLADMKQTVEQMVSRMPAHHDYVASMKRYLEKQVNV